MNSGPEGEAVYRVDLELLAPCGIYCGVCDMREAHITGNTAAQQKIAEWLVANAGVECKASDIVCESCRGPLDRHWSPDCRILACARERNVRLCVECDDWETCETIAEFHARPQYQGALRNLERIREIGIEGWAEEVAPRFDELRRKIHEEGGAG